MKTGAKQTRSFTLNRMSWLLPYWSHTAIRARRPTLYGEKKSLGRPHTLNDS